MSVLFTTWACLSIKYCLFSFSTEKKAEKYFLSLYQRSYNDQVRNQIIIHIRPFSGGKQVPGYNNEHEKIVNKIV